MELRSPARETELSDVPAEAVAELPHLWKSQSLEQPVENLTLLQQSLLFAELSDIAYYQNDDVVKLAELIGMPRVRYFESDGAQAYLFSNEYDAVIVFRGTEADDWNDIKADLNALSAVAETVGRVHRGFKKEVDDLWPQLEEELVNNAKTLWMTGHSLGGAMATISAGRCKLSHIESNPAGLFTYGSPRVGNKRYVNYYSLDHYRWVNNNDIVTRTPPPWMGYRHTGRLLYFNARGKLKRISGWALTADRLRGTFRGLLKFKLDPLTDHLQTAYIDQIHALVEEEKQGIDVFAKAEPLLKRAVKRVSGK